jgi:methionyl-tRNA formyltransferase
MNLVFIGASRFGLRCLELACSLPDCKLTGVVTAPQKFAISYRPEGVTNVLYADIASFAADRGLPCRTIGRAMGDPALLETVRAWKPEAFLVAGWYHMIPKAWRELAPAYGLHASLLPDYSGGAPLVWAMINGESRTGITLFQMDDGVDTGPIVRQVEEAIDDRDTIATLYARIEEQGLVLLRDALPRLATGTAVLQAQS